MFLQRIATKRVEQNSSIRAVKGRSASSRRFPSPTDSSPGVTRAPPSFPRTTGEAGSREEIAGRIARVEELRFLREAAPARSSKPRCNSFSRTRKFPARFPVFATRSRSKVFSARSRRRRFPTSRSPAPANSDTREHVRSREKLTKTSEPPCPAPRSRRVDSAISFARLHRKYAAGSDSRVREHRAARAASRPKRSF